MKLQLSSKSPSSHSLNTCGQDVGVCQSGISQIKSRCYNYPALFKLYRRSRSFKHDPNRINVFAVSSHSTTRNRRAAQTTTGFQHWVMMQCSQQAKKMESFYSRPQFVLNTMTATRLLLRKESARDPSTVCKKKMVTFEHSRFEVLLFKLAFVLAAANYIRHHELQL